ncbi:MAG: AAA family ATPase [Rhodobacteraceae bacterium]|nr:AAA family ATPase [Paracoccaceae bacterium]MCY4141058.1 AAA family ATPase [Paracoccaceae bacterium]
MAIFHFTAQVISATDNRSAVAAAAYRHAAKMERAADGRSHDYHAKPGVKHEEIILPPGAPGWAAARFLSEPVKEASERLWNDIEARENKHSRRATAALAKEIEFSLPVELTRGEQIELARDFIVQSLVVRGYTCDWVLHHAAEDNPHIHVMYTERELASEPGGWGNKIRVANRRQQLLELRAEWAMAANRHLVLAGHEARIDHRSHKDRGLEIDPGVHRGSMPSDPDDFIAWKARVNEDAAITISNEQWLREHPEELVKLAGSTHEVVTRPVLVEEALSRLSFANRDDAEAYVEKAVQSRLLVPARWSGSGDEAWNSTLHLEQVRDVVSAAEALADAPFFPAAAVPASSLEGLDLNAGQRQAAEAIVGAESRLALVSGMAGTGKTQMLQTAAAVLAGQGIAVLGAAPSGRAAADMAIPNLRTRTVAGWLQQQMAWTVEGQPFVFVLGEAGMVGMRDVVAVAQAVEARGGKLVLLGETEQLQPIAAGTPFRILRDRFGAVETAWVMRQEDKWDRLATIALARGQPQDALKHYSQKGVISEHVGTGAAVQAIAEDYWAAEGKSISLAHRNVDADRINEVVRAAGVEAGLVAAFQQYDTASGVVRFAAGDRVIANAAMPVHKILKGAFGVVQVAADGGLEVVFDGRHDPVSLDDRMAVRLGLGYAVTIHESQGVTADNAFVLAGGTMDKHLGYVALSRHRRHLRLYVDRSSVDGVDQLARCFRRRKEQGPEISLEALGVPARETLSELVEVRPEVAQQDARSDGLVAVMEKAVAYYQGVLEGDGGTEARAYLEDRGIAPGSIERFGIGFAPREGAGLTGAMAAEFASAEGLVDAGLIVQPDNGDRPYDRFRDRVMFPIRDRWGRCIAFGGRALDPHAREKHLVSPASALFDENKNLYNFDAARAAAAEGGVLVVAENYMDVIALSEAGLAGAVAPLGTAVTSDQLELMWQTSDRLLVMVDGDDAGRRAAYQVIDRALPLLGPNRSLGFAILPEEADPGTLVRREQLETLCRSFADNRSLLDLLWQRETAGRAFDSPERRAALDAALMTAVDAIPHAGIRAKWIADLAVRQTKMFGFSTLVVPAEGGPDSAAGDANRPVVDVQGVRVNGPGTVAIDSHVESVVQHYSNLLAAAAPRKIATTEIGRRLAANSADLARLLADRHSAWSVTDAARFLTRHVADPLTFRRVLTETFRNPDVMTVLPESPEHPERLLSTWSCIQAEADLVADAQLLADRQSALPVGEIVAESPLTAAQRKAMKSLSAGPALQIVDGGAGVGKTTVLATMHAAAAKAGFPISVIGATAADAAVLRAIVSNPDSVSTVRQPSPGDPGPRLYLVDSAENIGQKELAHILRQAVDKGSKVVLAGDQRSIDPLVVGSPYVALCDRLPVTRMEGSIRSRSPEEESFVGHLAAETVAGDRAAVQHLDRSGRLVGAPDMGAAVDAAVSGYFEDPTPDKMLLAHTRPQARGLNTEVMKRLEGRVGRVLPMLGGGSIDLAVGDVVNIQQSIPGSVVPDRRRASVTSLSDAGRIGLDFGEIEDGARYASVSCESVRLEHAWARTVRSACDAASSVHFLAGATNNRQTTYVGMTRHRDELHVYVPDQDPAGFVGRLLSTAGRQRFALDFAPDLAPAGVRVFADYLEADGGGREDWLELIHRTGKGRAMDRAMGEVGEGVLDFAATSWLDRFLRMSAIGSESSAQRELPDYNFRNRPVPFVGGLFRSQPGPLLHAIGDALTETPGRPGGGMSSDDALFKNASLALSVAVGAGDAQHSGIDQDTIRRTLAVGAGNHWLERRMLDRKAEPVATDIALKRAEMQTRRGLLSELGISERVLRNPVSWEMVPADARRAYEKRLPSALATARAAPTEVDMAVARAAAVADERGDTEARDCVAACRAALESAPVRSAAEIERDRDALVREMVSGRESAADPLLHRLHRAFTASEIKALVTGDEALPSSLPKLSDAERRSISDRLLKQARELSPALSAPWAGRVRSLVMDRGLDGWSRLRKRRAGIWKKGFLNCGNPKRSGFWRLPTKSGSSIPP